MDKCVFWFYDYFNGDARQCENKATIIGSTTVCHECNNNIVSNKGKKVMVCERHICKCVLTKSAV